MIDTNETAPDFTLPQENGADITLSALRPGTVVLYFYPRDDTSGCTREALDFTAEAAAFEASDTVVLGVSKDSVEAHAKFRAKHDLAVRLLSDEEGSVCESYGVWGEKKMYGKTFMGIERATFLIDGAGVIRQVWRKVKVPGHVEEVLRAAQKI